MVIGIAVNSHVPGRGTGGREGGVCVCVGGGVWVGAGELASEKEVQLELALQVTRPSSGNPGLPSPHCQPSRLICPWSSAWHAPACCKRKSMQSRCQVVWIRGWAESSTTAAAVRQYSLYRYRFSSSWALQVPTSPGSPLGQAVVHRKAFCCPHPLTLTHLIFQIEVTCSRWTHVCACCVRPGVAGVATRLRRT